MLLNIVAIVEAMILASSLSIDALAAGLAYGSKKIKIPMLSVQIISIVCTLVTGISIFIGTFCSQYIPSSVTKWVAFTILFVIGIVKLLDGITKSFIIKHSNLSKRIKISVLNFDFILLLYANPEKADVDYSNDLAPKEAAAIALALSLDGMAVGFGAALADVNGWIVVLWSLAANAAGIILGHYIGNKIADRATFNVAWVSGVILICLAFFKILY